ncbi:MAG: tripartite tricarboxylate transporter substrate binding protein [Pseudomonadota bacterium]
MNLTRRMIALGASLLLLASAIGQTSGQASDYPKRPVKIIVPYGPGSAADVVARLLGEGLSQIWGQTVTVENRPGASGVIGVQTLLRSPNDGHDFFFGDIGSLGLNPLYFKKLPYSPGRDLVSVVDIFHAPLVVYVSKDSPYKTVGELIAAARKSPGKLTFATPGAGGPMWIGAEQLGVKAGTKLLHVPFKEMGPLLTAVATGEVDLMVTSAATARPVLDRLRPLAVTDSGRLAELPAIPTVQEAMNLDVQVVAWAMLVAARGTPRRIVEKVRADALTAMKKPEFSGKTKLFGLNPSKEMTVDQLDAFIVSESEKYAPAVKASGVSNE